MTDAVAALGVGVVVFAATNVDDLVLLTTLFGAARMRARSIVVGQFLGIGALVALSAIAALGALAIPPGYPGLLGLVPLALGVLQLLRSARGDESAGEGEGEEEDANAHAGEHASGNAASARTSRAGDVLTIAGITVANGGDNLAVYVPLFARDPSAVPLYAAVFAAMTALWCFVAHRLARSRSLAAPLARHGHHALPWVLIALGLWILADARVLLA